MKDQKNLTTDKLINSRFDYGLKRECAVQYKNIGQLISSTKWDYLQHLSIWNNFIEDQKNEPSHFLEAFKALALNYDESLSSPVIVDRSSESLVNGSHRLAVHGNNIELLKHTFIDSSYSYRYNFFENYTNYRTGQQFPLDLLNRMAVYNSYHQELNAAIIFPKTFSTDRGKYADICIRENMNVCGSFDYTIPLSLIPLLILHLYPQHPWIWKNQTIQMGSVNHKANEIFNPHSLQRIRLYLVNNSSDSLLEIKKVIRDHYQMGNDTIHTTDSSKECSLLTEFLQSSRLLSKAFPTIDLNSSSINTFFSDPIYRHHMSRHHHHTYSVVSGTTIFNLSGFGKSSDIDFIFPKINKFPTGHQSYDYLFGIDTDCFPLNLRDTVSILGYRCLQPQIVAKMKSNRNEPKDRFIPKPYKYP